MADTTTITPAYLVEAIVIIGGTAILTFWAKRKVKKGKQVAY